MKKLIKQNTLMCFTPLVMIVTFFIEVALVLHALIFRQLNKTVRLSVAILIFLAIFQLAEYGVCEGLGLSSSVWSRVGFASITMLPPVGIHLVYTLAKKKSKYLVPLSYGVAFIWISIFIFGNIMSKSICEGNYVIFNISSPQELLYYIYYDLLLLVAIIQAFRFAAKATAKNVTYSLRAFAVGYLSFIVPTLIVRAIYDTSSSSTALPSIMCGFAVIFAVILSFKVLPKSSKPRKTARKIKT